MSTASALIVLRWLFEQTIYFAFGYYSLAALDAVRQMLSTMQYEEAQPSPEQREHARARMAQQGAAPRRARACSRYIVRRLRVIRRRLTRVDAVDTLSRVSQSQQEGER